MKNFATRLVLLLSTLCLWTSAQAQPGGSACPPEPKSQHFGYFVQVGANADVGGAKNDKKDELTCWVAGPSKNEHNRLESHGQYADFTSEYSYTVGPAGISASARVYGQVHSVKDGSGGGHADLWLMWHDTLTFHSNKRTRVTSGDFYKGTPNRQDLAAGSTIRVKVRLLQDPPQCSGASNEFIYQTGVIGAFRSLLTNSNVTAPGDIPTQTPKGSPITAENWFIRAGKCGIPNGFQIVDVPNGYDLALRISVNADTQGNIDHGKTQEGHLKMELSNIRACVVHPEKTSDLADLTITSASGADYWCP
jgi:hypothetical protein